MVPLQAWRFALMQSDVPLQMAVPRRPQAAPLSQRQKQRRQGLAQPAKSREGSIRRGDETIVGRPAVGCASGERDPVGIARTPVAVVSGKSRGRGPALP